MAELEVAILKESDQEFVLDKNKFSPTTGTYCFYGQTFGEYDSVKAMDFKRNKGIAISESGDFIATTFLEEFLSDLWSNGKKEKVYKIVEQFATWKDREDIGEENLFTY